MPGDRFPFRPDHFGPVFNIWRFGLGVLCFVVFVSLVVVGVLALLRVTDERRHRNAPVAPRDVVAESGPIVPRDPAEEELRLRLAKGQISEAEYRSTLELLRTPTR